LARTLWHYLLARTGGRISVLSGLLRSAAVEAVENGSERIDRALLDSIPTDWATQSLYTARQRTGKQKARKAS